MSPKLQKLYFSTRWPELRNSQFQTNRSAPNEMAYVKLYWQNSIKPLNAELDPICHLLALLGVHHFLHVSRIRFKSLTLSLLMSYTYGAPILDVSRSHTTTQHSR
jgi:hypothetical protein